MKIIYLTDHLCKAEGIGRVGGTLRPGEIEDTCRELGLTHEAQERVVGNLKAEVAETKAFFGITTTQ